MTGKMNPTTRCQLAQLAMREHRRFASEIVPSEATSSFNCGALSAFRSRRRDASPAPNDPLRAEM